MLNNSSKIMFNLILIMSTLISISANSWLSAWIGLEINLMSFIPLMNDNNKLMSTESSLKYFLTQALASSVLLFAMISLYSMNLEYMNIMINMLISSSLLLKMGAAPFHFWFPNVMEGLSWFNALILLTWQKIAPLMLISYLMFKSLMIISLVISSMIGAFGGLNQTSLRKLMAYSSINHLGWMMASIFNSNSLWLIYFLFYSMLSMVMILMFNLFELSHINQLFSLFFISKPMKFIILCNLLSMGGLPPFMGFFPKWLVIQQMTTNNQMFLMMVLTLMTLITLYFYIRLTYSAFLLNYFEINWINFSKFNMIKMNLFMIFTFISIFWLFLMNFLYL